jgi:hypothetical protein
VSKNALLTTMMPSTPPLLTSLSPLRLDPSSPFYAASVALNETFWSSALMCSRLESWYRACMTLRALGDDQVGDTGPRARVCVYVSQIKEAHMPTHASRTPHSTHPSLAALGASRSWIVGGR